MLFWVYLVLFAVFGLYLFCTFCRFAMVKFLWQFNIDVFYFVLIWPSGLLCCLSDIPLALPSVSFTLPPPMSGTSS